jgi:RNA polymerase sigma-70 factor (ECF subfamily)
VCALALHSSAEPPAPPPPLTALPFEDVYTQHFDFVWRNVRRLGVPEASIDDAVQEVFMVLHRRRADFEGRAALTTWLFRILVKVCADHRRTLRRKSPHARFPGGAVDLDAVPAGGDGPHEQVAQREAAAILHRLLDELDDDKRTVFVLAELEGLTMPEIAETLGLNLNTAYARLRAAHKEFERAVAREQARDARRVR